MLTPPTIRFGADYNFDTKRLSIKSVNGNPESEQVSWGQLLNLTTGISDLFNKCGEEGVKDTDRPGVEVAGLKIELGGKGEQKLTAKDIKEGKLTGTWHLMRRSFTAFREALAVLVKKAYSVIVSAENKMERFGQVFSSLFGNISMPQPQTTPSSNEPEKKP